MISLERFELSDLKDLERIIELNISAAGTRKKDWKKFIEWNMSHPDDLYWKIVLRDPLGSPTSVVIKKSSEMIGYLGYDDATRKLTTRDIAKPGDLFLEIYFDPEYTGKGYGYEAFNRSLDLIPENCERIYASTYVSNVGAHKFFGGKLGMTIIKFDERLGVSVFEYKVNRILSFA